MVHEHMAGQIIANASKLFILDDGLKNTISQMILLLPKMKS